MSKSNPEYILEIACLLLKKDLPTDIINIVRMLAKPPRCPGCVTDGREFTDDGNPDTRLNHPAFDMHGLAPCIVCQRLVCIFHSYTLTNEHVACAACYKPNYMNKLWQMK